MSNGWTVGKKTSPCRASKFENLSYGLAIVIMDSIQLGVHCIKVWASEIDLSYNECLVHIQF